MFLAGAMASIATDFLGKMRMTLHVTRRLCMTWLTKLMNLSASGHRPE